MEHAEGHGHHITALRTLLFTFLALVALTVVTVITAQIDLGAMNVPLALTIAIGKATLVVAFFMALKYDNKVNFLVLTVGLIMVVVFVVFTLFDTAFRGDIDNVDERTIDQIERIEAAAKG
ncbi:MAG: cytochrome C oxidase subunit IV family protein [Rhodothermia bacterium]|nr:cytochrome C oxidase subunit IV family protein [Rhodothermia bacterium]